MDRLKEMLERHEGRRRKPYHCPAGHRTIGIGWNYDANPLPPEIAAYLRIHGEITDTMIYQLLDISIDAAERNCRDIYPDFGDFSENRRFALIDFMFNVGPGTAQKFRRANRAINAGDWESAADEMMDSAWYQQVGHRGPEIVEMIRKG